MTDKARLQMEREGGNEEGEGEREGVHKKDGRRKEEMKGGDEDGQREESS